MVLGANVRRIHGAKAGADERVVAGGEAELLASLTVFHNLILSTAVTRYLVKARVPLAHWTAGHDRFEWQQKREPGGTGIPARGTPD